MSGSLIGYSGFTSKGTRKEYILLFFFKGELISDYLLSAYYKPGTMQVSVEAATNKIDLELAFIGHKMLR